MSNLAYSQNNDLTPEEMDSYKARCIEYMNAFQKGLSIIADKSKSDAVKQHQKDILLTFFMGEGEPWKDNKGHSYPEVQMEVTTVRYGKNIEEPHSIPIKKYLNNLQNLRYKQVKITQAKNCVISNLYQVEDHYEATVSYFQFFEGDRGDGTFYRDMTQKDVKVYLTKVTDGNLGTFWDLKFGDIKAVETVKI
ncbi:MAG: hypothetical protein HDS44_03025 [Bacteroides sp.]|nr:hypothetical protein [Bacteroides sp.]